MGTYFIFSLVLACIFAVFGYFLLKEENKVSWRLITVGATCMGVCSFVANYFAMSPLAFNSV